MDPWKDDRSPPPVCRDGIDLSRQLSLMRGNVGMRMWNERKTKIVCVWRNVFQSCFLSFFCQMSRSFKLPLPHLFDIKYDVKKKLNQNSPVSHGGFDLHNLNSIRNICCDDARERLTRCDGIIISAQLVGNSNEMSHKRQNQMEGHNVDRFFV